MSEQNGGPMTFSELRAANLARLAQAWPEEDPWAPWDWTNATAGEVGEACVEGLSLIAALSAKAGTAANLTKKMNRVWPAGQFPHAWNKPEDQRIEELTDRLANELADVVIYADLLASKLGRSLADAVRDKFNAKSQEIGSSVMLKARGREGMSPDAAQWQPIDSAPKDGTPIVLFGTLWNDPAQRPRACVSWYCLSREDSPAYALGWFFAAPGYTNGFNPTH